MENRKIIQLFVFFVALFAACASDKDQAQVPGGEQVVPGATKWGFYNGEPVTKWNPDGRTMTLLTELRYTDPKGNVWVAPDRIACRWGVHSALPLVVHGRAIRRKISECLRIARCRVWGQETAVARLRPHVLLRHALQRGERR